MAYPTTGVPVDWTNGGGVIPAGGSIAIPANVNRHFLCISTSGANPLTVTFGAVKASDGSATTASLVVQPNAAFWSDLFGFVPLGTVTISGTAGQAVTALEA